jgi:hypothetical protein
MNADCTHAVRKYDDRGIPYCDLCGADLRPDYQRLPYQGGPR